MKPRIWVVALVTAATALATAWVAPHSNAVTLRFGETSVKQGGATYYAKGSWTISQSNGTRYQVAGTTRKTVAGGNSGYWAAPLQSSAGLCITGVKDVSVSCHLEYYGFGELQGTRFNSTYWNSSTKYKAVNANAKTASAGMKSCVDVRFAFDPCASVSWTNGIQYRS